MKEVMNISYHQFKLQLRFFKSIGANLSSDHTLRALHKSLTRDDVDVKTKQFDSTKTEHIYTTRKLHSLNICKIL